MVEPSLVKARVSPEWKLPVTAAVPDDHVVITPSEPVIVDVMAAAGLPRV